MATSSVKGNYIQTGSFTASGVYSTFINTAYTNALYTLGKLNMLCLALEFKAHATTDSWQEIGTLPNTSTINTSMTVISNQGKAKQVRVNGNKLYVNLVSASTLGEVISLQILYFA